MIKSWTLFKEKLCVLSFTKVGKKTSYFVFKFLNFKLIYKTWIVIRIQGLQKCGSNADPDPKPLP